jgi:hypothetical protein
MLFIITGLLLIFAIEVTSRLSKHKKTRLKKLKLKDLDFRSKYLYLLLFTDILVLAVMWLAIKYTGLAIIIELPILLFLFSMVAQTASLTLRRVKLSRWQSNYFKIVASITLAICIYAIFSYVATPAIDLTNMDY